MTENGMPKIVKYIADSTGVELWVQPVSPFTFRAIRQKAFERYPDPDEKPYELPMPNAALPGEMIPGRENPDWIKASSAQIRLRNEFITEAIIVLACALTPNKDDLIRRFSPELEAMIPWIVTINTPWETTLLHCILRGKGEPQHISDIASEDLPLTPDEVVEGVGRFFRYQLPGETAVLMARKSSRVS